MRNPSTLYLRFDTFLELSAEMQMTRRRWDPIKL